MIDHAAGRGRLRAACRCCWLPAASRGRAAPQAAAGRGHGVRRHGAAPMDKAQSVAGRRRCSRSARPTRLDAAKRAVDASSSRSSSMADLSGLDRFWLALVARAAVVVGAPARIAGRSARGAMRSTTGRSATSSTCSASPTWSCWRKSARAHGLPEPLAGVEAAAAGATRCCFSSAAPVSGAIASITASPRRCASWWPRQRAIRTLDVDLIPVTVLWGRAPDREGSWLRMLLSENWERVGRFRRLLSVVVNGRNLFVQFGEPVSLRAAARRRRRIQRAPCVASRARCASRWRGSARRRSGPTCRIGARSSRRCCAPAPCVARWPTRCARRRFRGARR